MSFTLDHSYKVLTSNGTFKGKVSALDSKFVTLEYWFERKSNFTMISLDSILSSESIPNESSNGFILSSNPDFIKAREDKAIYKRTEMALKLGKNVTPLAQAIFDALSIMPCRWEGDSIVIMDSVTKPYLPENCIGANNSQLTRVKTIVAAERKKLKV